MHGTDTGNDPHAIAQGPNRKMRADENVIFDGELASRFV
jgi:hypothetical protein